MYLEVQDRYGPKKVQICKQSKIAKKNASSARVFDHMHANPIWQTDELVCLRSHPRESLNLIPLSHPRLIINEICNLLLLHHQSPLETPNTNSLANQPASSSFFPTSSYVHEQ